MSLEALVIPKRVGKNFEKANFVPEFYIFSAVEFIGSLINLTYYGMFVFWTDNSCKGMLLGVFAQQPKQIMQIETFAVDNCQKNVNSFLLCEYAYF